MLLRLPPKSAVSTQAGYSPCCIGTLAVNNGGWVPSMTQTFHVPKPPLNYLPRPDQLEPLVELLLSERPEAVGVVGVQGMGGIGKSVLAAAAAGEKRLQEAIQGRHLLADRGPVAGLGGDPAATGPRSGRAAE